MGSSFDDWIITGLIIKKEENRTEWEKEKEGLSLIDQHTPGCLATSRDGTTTP